MATASAPTGVANEDHLVTVAWTENLARIAEKLRARFIFVSSVMVFSGAGENGPFHETSVPRTPHPYGVLKRAAEEMLQQRYSHTTIARIGWQIAQSVDGNQMVAHLSAQNAREGRILVNRNWKPACSFVEDSATALEMLLHREPGLFHIDSNRNWSFSDIARALDEKLQAGWNLEEEDGPHFDQRLISNSRLVQTLAHRLPVLEIFP
jgi:dTDP-4-dehydrorhamnose reductase